MRQRTVLLLLMLGAACAFLPGRGGRRPYRPTVEWLLTGPRAPRFLVCGHRGDLFGSLVGEGYNTIASFERAMAAGADMVEVDVRTSRDLVPVIAHDEDHGEAPLTLRETLDWARGRIVLVLDLKTREIPRVVGAVLEADAAPGVVFYASNRREYEAVRAAGRDVHVMVRARNHENVREWLAEGDPHIVLIHGDADWMTRGVVEEIHAAGLRPFANSYKATWHQEVLGAESSAGALFEAGIDVAQSNSPAGACRARDRYLEREGEARR